MYFSLFLTGSTYELSQQNESKISIKTHQASGLKLRVFDFVIVVLLTASIGALVGAYILVSLFFISSLEIQLIVITNTGLCLGNATKKLGPKW